MTAARAVLTRTATPADIPALCELLSLLFAQEEEFTPNRQAQRSGLAQIIDNSEVGAVLLAQTQGQIVGMVTLLLTVSTALGGRVALLEDMVVLPESRGTGIGTRLLAEATKWGTSRRCTRITLLTDRDNESAQRLYRRHGFVESPMIAMRLSL